MKTGDGTEIGSYYPTFMPYVSATYGPERFPLVLSQTNKKEFTTEEFLEWVETNLEKIEEMLNTQGRMVDRPRRG